MIWMFNGKVINEKINQIHERAQRIAFQDETSSFEGLLITNDNLQLIVAKIYRTRVNLNPSFMRDIFVERKVHYYNLRVTNIIYARKPRTTAYELGNISCLEQNLWQRSPNI